MKNNITLKFYNLLIFTVMFQILGCSRINMNGNMLAQAIIQNDLKEVEKLIDMGVDHNEKFIDKNAIATIKYIKSSRKI